MARPRGMKRNEVARLRGRRPEVLEAWIGVREQHERRGCCSPSRAAKASVIHAILAALRVQVFGVQFGRPRRNCIATDDVDGAGPTSRCSSTHSGFSRRSCDSASAAWFFDRDRSAPRLRFPRRKNIDADFGQPLQRIDFVRLHRPASVQSLSPGVRMNGCRTLWNEERIASALSSTQGIDAIAGF